jgi:HAD superfamily phosphatase (TIGR01668 family)
MISVPSIFKPRIWYHLIFGIKVYPWKVLENINRIDTLELEKEGVKGIIFDVDNTLTLHDHTEIHPSVKDKFNHLTDKFKCVIFSNCNSTRYEELKTIFNIPIVDYGIKKPSPAGYKRALEILELKPSEAAMVGDRLLTDILGANALGIKSILINPFNGPEPKAISIIRRLEKMRVLIDK